MGTYQKVFGRGDVVDRGVAAHPWVAGAAGLVVMAVVLAGITAAVAGSIRWGSVALFSAVFAAMVVGIGYGRRRRLARGLR